jgi:hypothetical protein
MKLEFRSQHRIEERQGVIGPFLWAEAGLLQQTDCPGPIVEYEQVDINHRAVSDGVVQPLGEGGPFERQATQAAGSEEILDASGRVELAHSPGEIVLDGLAERLSAPLRPASLSFADRLMQ